MASVTGVMSSSVSWQPAKLRATSSHLVPDIQAMDDNMWKSDISICYVNKLKLEISENNKIHKWNITTMYNEVVFINCIDDIIIIKIFFYCANSRMADRCTIQEI